MVKRGYSEEMMLGDGLWFGWMGDEKFVSGVLATAVLKLGGFVVSWIGKVSLSCCTPDSLCDRGQVIPWNFVSQMSSGGRQVLINVSNNGNQCCDGYLITCRIGMSATHG